MVVVRVSLNNNNTRSSACSHAHTHALTHTVLCTSFLLYSICAVVVVVVVVLVVVACVLRLGDQRGLLSLPLGVSIDLAPSFRVPPSFLALYTHHGHPQAGDVGQWWCR